MSSSSRDSLSQFDVTGKVHSVEFGGTDNLELWVHKTDGTLKGVSIKEGLKGTDTKVIL